MWAAPTGASGVRSHGRMRSRRAASLPEPGPRLRVLSPFDPALRDRKQGPAERLFGFSLPDRDLRARGASVRHGYYVFPVLEGTRLAGADRHGGGGGAGRALKVRGLLGPSRVCGWAVDGAKRLVDEIERVAVLAGMRRCGVRTGLAPREPLTCAQLIHMWISGFFCVRCQSFVFQAGCELTTCSNGHVFRRAAAYVNTLARSHVTL